MAIRVIDDSKLQNIAVAIQGKDGGGQMTVDEMPTRIAAIPTRDNTTLNSLIDRSITSIENSEVTSIGSYVFYGCGNLTSVSFPNVASIGGYAFQNCSNLASVSLPNVTSIGGYAFHRSGLRNLYAPSTITLASNSFFQAFYVTRLFFPNVEEIGRSSFEYCRALSTIVLHKHANLLNSNILDNGCPAIIYVKPEDLSWFSTATNWSTLYVQNRIKSIEDLTGDDLVWYQEQLARYQAQTA